LFEANQVISPVKWKFVYIDEGLYRLEDEFGFCLMVHEPELKNVMIGEIEKYSKLCSYWEIQYHDGRYAIVLGRKGDDQIQEVDKMIGYGLVVRKASNSYQLS
jgi:hypothetical protein